MKLILNLIHDALRNYSQHLGCDDSIEIENVSMLENQIILTTIHSPYFDRKIWAIDDNSIIEIHPEVEAYDWSDFSGGSKGFRGLCSCPKCNGKAKYQIRLENTGWGLEKETKVYALCNKHAEKYDTRGISPICPKFIE